jgi:hypothetical protein
VERAIVILGVPGSRLGPRLARRLEARGAAVAALSQDAVWRGAPVTVQRAAVEWNGVALDRAGAVLVERPIFPWPQPQRLDDIVHDGAPDPGRAAAEREARALALSALRAAAERTAVLNRPDSVHVVASPATGLTRAAAAGLAVQPWTFGPAPDDAGGRVVLDSVGAEYWHAPSRPAPGEPAILVEPVGSSVWTLLVARRRILSGREHPNGGAWGGTADTGPAAADGWAGSMAPVASAAAAASGLDIAAVTLTTEEPHRVVWVDGAPDLEAWEGASEESVGDGLCDLLLEAADAGKGGAA